MRTNSKKQIAANRANSANSTGPKSADGKQRSRLNALRDGLFSRDVVVTAARERVDDFEKLKASVRDDLQPDGTVEAMLAHDYSVNWWRRERVRRCESAEIKSRLDNPKTHDCYLRSDEIERLKIRFQLSMERYQATTGSTPCGDQNEIVTELEDARRQMASTPLGLEFLIKRVNAVKEEAELTGQMSLAAEGALRACAGIMNERAVLCGLANVICKRKSAKAAERAQAGQCGGAGRTKEIEPEKPKGERSGGKREAGEKNEADCKFVLVSLIKLIAFDLAVPGANAASTRSRFYRECRREVGSRVVIVSAFFRTGVLRATA